MSNSDRGRCEAVTVEGLPCPYVAAWRLRIASKAAPHHTIDTDVCELHAVTWIEHPARTASASPIPSPVSTD
jgi:hypothetical protein